MVMRIFITYELESMKKARDVLWILLMRTPLTQIMRETNQTHNRTQTLASMRRTEERCEP